MHIELFVIIWSDGWGEATGVFWCDDLPSRSDILLQSPGGPIVPRGWEEADKNIFWPPLVSAETGGFDPRCAALIARRMIDLTPLSTQNAISTLTSSRDQRRALPDHSADPQNGSTWRFQIGSPFAVQASDNSLRPGSRAARRRQRAAEPINLIEFQRMRRRHRVRSPLDASLKHKLYYGEKERFILNLAEPIVSLPDTGRSFQLSDPIPASRRLVLMYPLDPRGQKIGGIESHVRLVLQHAPADWSVLFVGVDGRGDCRLGEAVQMTFRGRNIDFLPVLFYPEEQVHQAAKSIGQSITARFFLGLIRHFAAIKRAVGHMPVSVELQRFEFASIPFLMGYPVVQVIHGEGSRGDKMDSLIKKYWFVHQLNEQIAIRLADRIVCVNPNILTRLEKINTRAAQRAVFMPVPVDTEVFGARDFEVSDGVLRVVFAGRLDEFKDPPTKFRVLARVHELLGGACEFHYIGLSEPRRYKEFSLVEKFTICHGFQPPTEVANLMARCHMGILTSFFEGMPCYLLEMISVGRPVAAIRLPQYDLLLEEGVSGTMTERTADNRLLVEQLASRIVEMWNAIKGKTISAFVVHAKAEPFSVRVLFNSHFARHEAIAR